MSEMPTWAEFEALVDGIGSVQSYDRDADTKRRRAKDEVRKAFYGMHRRARENETLRQMLVDLGVENARLNVEVEAMRATTPPTTPADMTPAESQEEAS